MNWIAFAVGMFIGFLLFPCVTEAIYAWMDR